MEKEIKNWHPGLSKKGIITPQRNTHNQETSFVDCRHSRIPLDGVEDQLKISKWRLETTVPIFKVIHFSYQSSSQGNAISKVVFELPEVLISALNDISIRDCLYCLKTALTSCEKLLQKFKPFKLTSKMIGITQGKICKVWVNERFHKNKVMHYVKNQQETVLSLVSIFNDILQKDQIGENFIKQIRQVKPKIEEIKKFVSSFSQNNNIIVPPLFEKICENSVLVKKVTHKKTVSYALSKDQSTNHNTIMRQSELDMQVQIKNSKASFKSYEYKSTQTYKCFQFKSVLKLNNTQMQMGPLTTRTCNAKSLCVKKGTHRRSTNDSNQKNKQNIVLNTSIQKISINQRREKSSHKNDVEQQDNKLKMKSLIKQKIRFNREKKRVFKLHAINTVKSIGEFTESERKIIQQNNSTLVMLHEMGRKILDSEFHIQSQYCLDFADNIEQ